ncbi:MAG: biotin/lipoyl-containing protein, partial [Pseudomonadota bacterium]
RAGDAIGPWYDPMIAKVIVHGPTRSVALETLNRVLCETEVSGTTTNLAFLGALTRHVGFASGDVDTGLIGRDLGALVRVAAVSATSCVAAAMHAAGLVVPYADAGFTLWAPLHRSVQVGHAGDVFHLSVQVASPERQIWSLNQDTITAEFRHGVWYLDGRQMPNVAIFGKQITVFDDYGQVFEVIDPLDRDVSAAGDTNVIEAPMPGLIKAVFATAGQNVKQGDRLAILEAMKMEHSLLAARDGVVAEVLAEHGAQVEAGAALIRLEDA